MRRTIVAALCAAIATAAVALPASAGAPKPVREEFTVQALPFPNYSSHTSTEQPGCAAGEEGVHRVTMPFEVPANGTLTVELAGFTGDWDLYVFDDAGTKLAASINDQATGGAAAEETIELAVTAKQALGIVVCNWLGAPEASGYYMFAGKKR